MLYAVCSIPIAFMCGAWLGAKLVYKDFKKNYYVEEKVIIKERHPSSGKKAYFYDQDVEDEFDDIIKRLQ